MSPRSVLAVAVVGAVLLSTGVAQTVAPAPGAESPEPAGPAPTPEQVFEVYGWALCDQANLEGLGLSASETEALVRGFAMGAKGEPPPASFKQVAPVAQQFLNDRARKIQDGQATENRAEEAAFLAKMDENPAVKKTASGLRYEIMEPGTGPKPLPTDTVVAHYTLSLPNGTVLESSRESGQPAEFALNAVIPAWTEGLQLIGAGGKMKLYVPSALGYGERGSPGGIPPAKALVFDVELVSVKPTPVQLPGMTPGPTPTP